MVVTQNNNVIAEREYYSAVECTDKMNQAKKYYECKSEYVEISMLDTRKLLIIKIQSFQERHIIFTYKEKVYQAFKKWEFERIEKVLTRLGATYWEIG